MKVLVIGGTGFLGYHACLELAQRGHDVTALGMPPAPPANLFPPTIKVVLNDLRQSTDRQLRQLLSGQDAVVFAAGADDRNTPPTPAAEFFYEANVNSTVRVAAAAVQAGVARMVVLGSYFTHFDRIWPHMQLAQHHPYIKSRKQQIDLSMAVAGDSMALVVLELPYIFGAMPGNSPLWTPLVNYVRSGVPLVYTRGGSNMVSVARVAEAIAGACERIDSSTIYQVGDRNVTWTEFLQGLCAIIGRRDDTVHIIEHAGIKSVSWILDAIHSLKGLEGGLHARHFADLLAADAFFNPDESRLALGYGPGGLEQAWRDTVAAAPPGVLFANWPHLLRQATRLVSARAGQRHQ